jgi:hypothetical protein
MILPLFVVACDQKRTNERQNCTELERWNQYQCQKSAHKEYRHYEVIVVGALRRRVTSADLTYGNCASVTTNFPFNYEWG